MSGLRDSTGRWRKAGDFATYGRQVAEHRRESIERHTQARRDALTNGPSWRVERGVRIPTNAAAEAIVAEEKAAAEKARTDRDARRAARFEANRAAGKPFHAGLPLADLEPDERAELSSEALAAKRAADRRVL